MSLFLERAVNYCIWNTIFKSWLNVLEVISWDHIMFIVIKISRFAYFYKWAHRESLFHDLASSQQQYSQKELQIIYSSFCCDFPLSNSRCISFYYEMSWSLLN